jgi:hypothetical protein
VSFSIGNTIIAGNVDTTNGVGATPDCEGELTSYQYNIIEDMGADCTLLSSTSDQLNTDPLLLPLGDNGGGHSTYDLASFSPAFDGGNPSVCLWDDDNDNATPPVALTWDARGYSRPANGRCDVGAVEHRLLNNGFEGGTTSAWSDVIP